MTRRAPCDDSSCRVASRDAYKFCGGGASGRAGSSSRLRARVDAWRVVGSRTSCSSRSARAATFRSAPRRSRALRPARGTRPTAGGGGGGSCPRFTTTSTPSTRFERTMASVTGTSGGVSRITTSADRLRLVMRSAIRAVPMISDGFGGKGPAGSNRRRGTPALIGTSYSASASVASPSEHRHHPDVVARRRTGHRAGHAGDRGRRR